MIPLEDVPQSGILIITVYFKGYKDNYANDARRMLRDGVPKLNEKLNLGITLTPLMFSLVRTIAEGVSRATGAQFQFGYSGMTPDKFKRIYFELKKLGDKCEWKDEIEIMVASHVGGIE
jgi:hypothetical protein